MQGVPSPAGRGVGGVLEGEEGGGGEGGSGRPWSGGGGRREKQGNDSVGATVRLASQGEGENFVSRLDVNAPGVGRH